ncbi:potassium channel family protein [Sphingomicrobium sediminis]|uniref:Potassium channel family protein n=1 Tax=Sphingomicrobium sediminis TaxID=2950949 RepID=A0A9X2EH15_9SPHN|nr:potassium channel family protein [Sphingomicrobium sediminis]MCM8557868.1 potassium channel family protein [Sphingomicrobium sediminis]
MWIEFILTSIALIGLCTIIHYEALRFALARFGKVGTHHRMRIVGVILVAFGSHLAHVILYALAFFFLERMQGFGSISGGQARDFADALYFSVTSYTTMGFADLFPTGTLRLLSGLEALVGLVMVAWTASITFLAMQKSIEAQDD